MSEMENLIIIITDHIKYIEAQKLRNTKVAYGRHRWELPGNYPVFTMIMVIYY